VDHQVTEELVESLGINNDFKIKKNDNPYPDPTTTTIVQLVASNKSKKLVKRPLYVLLDSGSSHSMIKGWCAKYGKRKKKWNRATFHTAAGAFATERTATMNFILTEFTENKRITWEFCVDDTPCNMGIKYDMVIGRDLLRALGIVMDFDNLILRWGDMIVDMHPPTTFDSREREFNALFEEAIQSKCARAVQTRVQTILDAKYEKANLKEVVNSLEYLNYNDKEKLLQLLTNYETIFDGTLGDWKCRPVSLELKPGATPYAAKPFPVPKIHEAQLKKEIERLVRLGVLVKDSDSPWSAPTFIIPKKDGTVRFVVSDFRQLNQRLLRKPYPIPNIGDLLAKLEGFTFATAIDLNMGYYNIRLTPDASSLCTIVTPWGKYKYLRLPMGVSCAPDIFQDRINDLLGDLEFVRAYLDDLLVLTKGSFEDHLKDLEVVLQRLRDAGLKCNAPKCSFAKQELEYLGYIITSEGIKPDPKKIEAILALERPKTVKDVRHLLGMVQYYRDVWQRRSHTLSPLTNLIGGEKSKKKNKAITWNKRNVKKPSKISSKWLQKRHS
jgi:hypothetical protein